MKITNVEAFLVPPRWVFTKVETDEGITGWGESSLENNARTQVTAVKALAPRLIGEDPLRIEHLWQVMYRGGFYRGGCVLVSALSGIDMALWDIFGKVTNLPVYQLLGGACRDRVRVYRWIHGGSPEELADKAKECIEQGFDAMKMCPTAQMELVDGIDELKKAEANVAAVRDAAGDTDIGLDFHGRVSPTMAIALADVLKPYRPYFIEEPVLCENADSLLNVKHATTIPIATGERLYTRHEFREVIEKEAAAVLQPDLAHCGGISEAKKIAAMAETHYMAIAPHCPLGPVSLAAAYHFAMSTPNFLIQEHVTTGEGYLKEPMTVENGYITLPGGPGLGIEVDEDACRAMEWEDWEAPFWRHKDGSVADW